MSSVSHLFPHNFCISHFSVSSRLLCHVFSLNPTVSRRNPRPPMRSPPKRPGLLSISSEFVFLYGPFSQTASYIFLFCIIINTILCVIVAASTFLIQCLRFDIFLSSDFHLSLSVSLSPSHAHARTSFPL